MNSWLHVRLHDHEWHVVTVRDWSRDLCPMIDYCVPALCRIARSVCPEHPDRTYLQLLDRGWWARPLIRIQIFQNMAYLENKSCCFWTLWVTRHPHMANFFLCLNIIRNEKPVKLLQLDTVCNNHPVLAGTNNVAACRMRMPLLYARLLDFDRKVTKLAV